MKVYNPKTRELLYDLKLVHTFDYKDVPSSPHLIPSEYEGFFAAASVGVSNINRNGYAAAFGLHMGYDWNFYKGLFAGFELGGNYDGKHSKDNVSVKSWNINAMLRAKYLFESGFNIVGKLGGAYVKNSQDNNDDIGNGIAPRAGVGVGYLFTNGIGVNLEYNLLFSTSKVNSINTFGVELSYIF